MCLGCSYAVYGDTVTVGQHLSANASGQLVPTVGSAAVVGVALDCDNGAIYFSKNGTWQYSGDPTSGASKTGAAFVDYIVAFRANGSSTEIEVKPVLPFSNK